jgi:hypothetical protein
MFELLIIFVLIFFIPWIIAFIDILKSEFEGNNKLIWLLAVILVPFIGALLYFFIGKKQKITTKTQPMNP